MRMRPCALVLVVLGTLLGGAAQARAEGDVAAALRAHDWDLAARLAAAQSPDPVATQLVTWLRLLTAGAASEAEIAAFAAANPDWPSQALLERRRQEALASDPDDAAVMRACATRPPEMAGAVLRCAEARARASDPAGAAAAARAAWSGGVVGAPAEVAFMQRWGGAIGADAQAARFDRLAWSDTEAAARQLLRLDPARRRVGEARLAFRRDDPSATAIAAALPAPAQADPGLVLEHARFLRRAGRDAEALALWLARGTAAERAAPAEARPAFWAERNLLARRLLRVGDAAGAYALAAGHAQTATEPAADAEFLAGFVALRFLHDPARARTHFEALAARSAAAITQGRAQYWIGRALAAAGADPTAAYTRAAAWPTTFYGQLAAVALAPATAADPVRARLAAARDPAWTRDAAIDFAGLVPVRAAALLLAWGEPGRARGFLLRLEETDADPATRAMAAHLALELGDAPAAVAIARRMGRDGMALPEAGWPAPVRPPEAVDPSLVLGLIRQESSFDAQAVSPSGARGLMQLMPATARAVARQVNDVEGDPVPALTTDPALNLRLGAAYLHDLLTRFGGAVPLAVAAYNAGPTRVRAWLDENGDPRAGAVDMVDWIELIPFGETRNYVQRVLENRAIYAARAGAPVTLALAR
jgi:soluble lytic murein transglycosylase